MRHAVVRTLDIATALLVLIVFSPVWVILALAVWIDCRGPVFIGSDRLGQNGRRFTLWRFRTERSTRSTDATEDADNAAGGEPQRSSSQPTRFGRFLRRFRLDEVPQLFNVLAGQMTVIGPRPENPALVRYCGDDYDQVLSVKPGITGCPGLTLFDEQRILMGARDRGASYVRNVLPLKVAADLQYVRHPGLRSHSSILAITGLQFLRGFAQVTPIGFRRVGKLAADALIVAAATLIAHYVRLGSSSARQLDLTLALIVPLIALRIGALYVLGAYRSFWRYTSGRDLTRLVLSTTVSSAMFGALLYVTSWGPATYPRSIFLIEWSLSTLGLMGVRAAVSSSRRLLNGRSAPARRDARRVLIYGGGDAGAALASSLLTHPDGRTPVAIIDDNPKKRGALLHGVPVVGDGSSIEQLVAALAIDEVIIAIPSATSEQIRRIIFRCENLPCKLTTLPSLSEILAGQRQDRVRKIQVEDLLERKPAQVDMEALAVLLSGERILVTGAGGSIGSELCRQIVSFKPQQLILLGHGENSVFEISQELRDDFGFEVTAVIADIQDRRRVEHVFRQHRPTVVFHAAAHKHVPLMEMHPEEAVKNNVLGTLNLAEVAVSSGVERFVMVSSDKAVNPTSVMGATKRVAEMVIQVTAHEPGVNTRFTTVRFGNVLGSRGSLIPVLRRQIGRGGPVTITHPEMVRYFMTIPEAVQLMLQASSMGAQGEVFVLDMGEPVKVVDLARNLIRLSGLVPNKDIQIVYTGIRPGEKLFEEMLTVAEGASATRHKQVFVARASEIDPELLAAAVARLEAAALASDAESVRNTLRELVPGYGLHAVHSSDGHSRGD